MAFTRPPPRFCDPVCLVDLGDAKLLLTFFLASEVPEARSHAKLDPSAVVVENRPTIQAIERNRGKLT